MAVKTMTIDMAAYEMLSRHKQAGQSFSDVIKAHFASGGVGADLLAAARQVRVEQGTIEGAAGAAHPRRERDQVRKLLAATSIVLPSESFARRYAETRVQIQRASRSISAMELLIATTALKSGAPLLTGNRRHFDLVPDLTVLTYR